MLHNRSGIGYLLPLEYQTSTANKQHFQGGGVSEASKTVAQEPEDGVVGIDVVASVRIARPVGVPVRIQLLVMDALEFVAQEKPEEVHHPLWEQKEGTPKHSVADDNGGLDQFAVQPKVTIGAHGVSFRCPGTALPRRSEVNHAAGLQKPLYFQKGIVELRNVLVDRQGPDGVEHGVVEGIVPVFRHPVWLMIVLRQRFGDVGSVVIGHHILKQAACGANFETLLILQTVLGDESGEAFVIGVVLGPQLFVDIPVCLVSPTVIEFFVLGG